MQEGLLEWLERELQLFYLSDLRNREKWPMIVTRLMYLPDGAYPLKEWNEALSYIFRTEYRDYSNVEQAKEACQEYLKCSVRAGKREQGSGH